MPRVLHILNRMSVGGHSIIISLLAKHMPAEYEMKLVVGHKEPHEKTAAGIIAELPIEMIEIPEMGRSISLKNDYIAYKKIKAVIEAFKPDIVHTHTSKPGAIGRWAAAHCKVPVIIHTYHGHVFHSYFSPLKTKVFIALEKKLAQKSTFIIAISNSQKQDFVQTYKIAEESKIAVVHLGLDLDQFRTNSQSKRNHFRTEFSLMDDDIAIGIIGRLVPIKHHQLFINAIHQLKHLSDKKIRGFIVGDGECRNSLESYCREIGIGYSTPEHPDYNQPLIFTSWRTDIDVVTAGLDIITLTSLNEGTPVSVIEAQAASKPIVATNCGGIKDVVIENETALISAIGDDEQFVKNLARVVNDDTMRENMSRKGAEFVFGKFDYHQLINATTSLYEQALFMTLKNQQVLI